MIEQTPHTTIKHALDTVEATLSAQRDEMSLRQLRDVHRRIQELMGKLGSLAPMIEEQPRVERQRDVLNPLDQTLDAASDLFTQFTNIGRSLTEWARERETQRHMPVDVAPTDSQQPAHHRSQQHRHQVSGPTKYISMLEELYYQLPTLAYDNLLVIKDQVDEVQLAINEQLDSRQAQMHAHEAEHEEEDEGAYEEEDEGAYQDGDMRASEPPSPPPPQPAQPASAAHTPPPPRKAAPPPPARTPSPERQPPRQVEDISDW